MMKKFNKAKVLLAVVLALCVPGCMGGCQNPERSAYVTTGLVIVSVDGAMKGWGDYVRAGKASAGDEAKVKAAYEKYQAVVRTQRAAVLSAINSPEGESAFNAALNAIDAAKLELINLIESLKKG